MTNLSSLIHELRERIASSAFTPQNDAAEDALEARFRAVLSNLFNSYIIPSKSANQREVVSVLKLLAHIANNLPGVFYHGKANAVLPVLLRLLPFFAESAFCSWHLLIYETIGSLLSLLRTQDCDAYRQVFVDSMLAIEDVLQVLSVWGNDPDSRSTTLKCFFNSSAGHPQDTCVLIDMPESNIPSPNGCGIMIDLASKKKWQSFSTWIIKLISRSMTEGTVCVEGLVNTSFVLAVCTLLCYGDADLHMACFDLVCILRVATNYELIHLENLILSILCILSHEKEGLPIYCNIDYDTSLGCCLHQLHSFAPDHVVQSTAVDLINVMPLTIQKSRSFDLKIAMCGAFIRVAKTCQIHVWKLESFIDLLHSTEPFVGLIECWQVVISLLGVDQIGGESNNCGNLDPLTSTLTETTRDKAGLKRSLQNYEITVIKRQKLCKENACSYSAGKSAFMFNKEIVEYVDCVRERVSSLVDLLIPDARANFPSPEAGLTSLSMLCIVFCKYPKVKLSLRIFEQINAWISLICEQARRVDSITFNLSIFLQALRSLFFLRSSVPAEDSALCANEFNDADLLTVVLKLPWTHTLIQVDNCNPQWKAKCFAIQVLSNIVSALHTESNYEVLDLGLNDTEEEVRKEAVYSMPLIVSRSGFGALNAMLLRISILGSEKHDLVKKVIPSTLGYLACLYSAMADDVNKGGRKAYVLSSGQDTARIPSEMVQKIWCSKCDGRLENNPNFHASSIQRSDTNGGADAGFWRSFCDIASLFSRLLYEDTLEEIQVSCVDMVCRILTHGSEKIPKKARLEWSKCAEFLILHKRKGVREAFFTHIIGILAEPRLSWLFSDKEFSGVAVEISFLGKIKDALGMANDPHIVVTLVECIAKIMSRKNIHSDVYASSFILLVDQLDNSFLVVRETTSKVLRESYFCTCNGKLERLLKAPALKDELVGFLSSVVVIRPAVLQEFAERVIGITTEKLVKEMVPIILPKLVVSHHDDDNAIGTLCDLSKCLSTDMVPLVVNWLPKVLAYSLRQSDGHVLASALEFYHIHTGSDTQEIFAAALPALLVELICCSDESTKRIDVIPQIVQKVSEAITGEVDLAIFLRSHFVGLLNSIDRKMLHSSDMLLQKQALNRIEMLIGMMGHQLGTYVPKIMVLLIHSINKEHLCTRGLSVLHFFVKRLAELSAPSARHVVSQLFAVLISFIGKEEDGPSDSHLSKIVQILEELVFENSVILKEHIHEFPALPSIPMLERVNKAVQESRGMMTLKDEFRNIIRGLNDENLNVRYMVSCELRKLLNLKREEVYITVAAESNPDIDLLSSLITSLLKGCAEESRNSMGQRLKLMCADCLGALGAIDPAKVRRIRCHRFKIECSDDDLMFELIHKHLARAFRSAPDTIVQDSAALAIQELLKAAGCEASLDKGILTTTTTTPSSSRSAEDRGPVCDRGQNLWVRFSSYVREIIAPCLTSRFQLPIVIDDTTDGPIYNPSMPFRKWIFFWIRKLSSHATGTRASIFNACRGIVRHDMQTAMYLLPYLVLNAICYGTQDIRDEIAQEILSVLNVAAVESTRDLVVQGSGSGQNEVCMQAVFTLLDNLGQWVDDALQEAALSQSLRPSAPKQQSKRQKKRSSSQLASEDQLQMHRVYVTELLAAIPKVILAKASFRCQAFARSLMYFESNVREKSGSFNPAALQSGLFDDDDVSFLMEIYSFLDEPDGLSGLCCLRKSSSLHDQILISKKAGNWAEVLTLSEQALEMKSPDLAQRKSDVLNCLLNMCHLQAMVTHVDGLITRMPEYKKTWCMQGVQAAWRLGRWDLMDEYLGGACGDGLVCSSSESNAPFEMNVARILQAMMKKDQFSVSEKIALSKQALVAPLAAAGMDSYARAYPIVVKLHMLHELEDLHTFLDGESFLSLSAGPGNPGLMSLVDHLETRLRFTQPSVWAREPLLVLRRLVFTAGGLGHHVDGCWLQYARLCRSSGHYETANRAILEAQISSGASSTVSVEKAKLMWSTRRSDTAIAELQQCLLSLPSDVLGSSALSSITNLSLIPPNALPLLPPDSQSSGQNSDVARTLLLYSKWIHYTGQKQKEDVMSLYTRVRELQPKWEKGYFYMAKYCDEVLVDARRRQVDSGDLKPVLKPSASADRYWWSYLPDVMLYYAKGLHRGHKNLFQALPRVLTLWFDFGSIYQRSASTSSASHKDLKDIHGKVMSIMRGCLKDLPTYHWLTVLPQLVSRICHQNDEIVRLVKHIIASVLRQYPQQALWIMATVSKSTIPSRRDAAAEIIQTAKKRFSQETVGGVGSSLFVQFASLVDHLIKLCFHPGNPKSKTINISTEFSSLKRMMPLNIIMPTQQSLSVNLQAHDATTPPDVFLSSDLPTISGIREEAEILSSLQRPKKVVFVGSDGAEKPFLCKPKDDLRKDARMMEFNGMVNRLLSKSVESRRRNLYIRTFAVVPLTEDCGMVEWVAHTHGLRHILQDIYTASGRFDRQKTNPQIKRIYDQCSAGKVPEDEMLKTRILPMFPPVFHRWFLTTFSEPSAWFGARAAYARTAAVWSMVGHIVGLGDRHGENILFDSSTGDCVHVDFSCLFDKGLQLEKPELVPFRLTQNMVDGLGITGYEGVFLRVSEITLSILRAHRETLMTILDTFIHDPLVEWTKSHKSSGVEVQNPHAHRAIAGIEDRLRGVVVGVGAAPSLPLAVEGQARRLISEAVSHRNLGKMYIWWMPWF